MFLVLIYIVMLFNTSDSQNAFNLIIVFPFLIKQEILDKLFSQRPDPSNQVYHRVKKENYRIIYRSLHQTLSIQVSINSHSHECLNENFLIS